MGSWQQRVKTWVWNKMDLPADVAMDLPRITMIGKLHIYIENHRGLLTFSDNEFRILLKHGQLMIKGDSFVIKILMPEEILLEGNIEQVLFIDD